MMSRYLLEGCAAELYAAARIRIREHHERDHSTVEAWSTRAAELVRLHNKEESGDRSPGSSLLPLGPAP